MNTLAQYNEEVTPAAFQLWLDKGRGGTHFVYHRGILAIDREDIVVIPSYGQPVHVFMEPFDTLGKMAWHAYERGIVELVQKKLDGQMGYEYIAFKRRTRRLK